MQAAVAALPTIPGEEVAVESVVPKDPMHTIQCHQRSWRVKFPKAVGDADMLLKADTSSLTFGGSGGAQQAAHASVFEIEAGGVYERPIRASSLCCSPSGRGRGAAAP